MSASETASWPPARVVLPAETRAALETVRENSRARSRLPRAVLYGPRGTGRTTCARALGRQAGLEVVHVDLPVDDEGVVISDPDAVRMATAAMAQGVCVVLRCQGRPMTGAPDGNGAETPDDRAGPGATLMDLVSLDGAVIVTCRHAPSAALLAAMDGQAVRFTVPGRADRETLWRHAFPETMWFDQNADLPLMLGRLELTAPNIRNAAADTVREARARGSEAIRLEDVLLAIEREVQREGRVFLHLLSGTALPPS